MILSEAQAHPCMYTRACMHTRTHTVTLTQPKCGVEHGHKLD